jgi:hypothetical protein
MVSHRQPLLTVLGIVSLSLLATGTLFAELPSEGSTAQEPPVYEYKPSRDPFIPLTGQGAGSWSSAATTEEEAFNPASLELKGILKTKSGRWAMLRGTTGSSFLVIDGKIQDAKRKSVKGYVGIVKEKSLVIIGPNNQVTELKLKAEDNRQP